ncbi:MAG: prefoldin subunit alpha [Candidatus Parvarchaeota archaeon]|nr:prefoldin subunit alpha [Candidatus Parvarchaeota archaeon]
MENNEEDLSKRLMEIEYIRRELENYINAINTLQMTQESISRSLSGLSELKHGDKEILVPYSPDIFFEGVINDSSSAIVNIGSNIFKRMEMKDIKKRLEEDLHDVESNISQIAQIIQKLQEDGTRLEQEANKLYEEYSGKNKQI